jgi:hypothetical protein
MFAEVSVGELSPVFLECDTPMGWWMEMISKLQIYPDRRSVWPKILWPKKELTLAGRATPYERLSIRGSRPYKLLHRPP